MALGKKTTASVSHDILKEKQQEISRLEQHYSEESAHTSDETAG